MSARYIIQHPLVLPPGQRRKPHFIGMNYAKRVARLADERDQRRVLAELGPKLPRQHSYHQELVRQRHAYYRDLYDADRLAAKSAS